MLRDEVKQKFLVMLFEEFAPGIRIEETNFGRHVCVLLDVDLFQFALSFFIILTTASNNADIRLHGRICAIKKLYCRLWIKHISICAEVSLPL